eukprot:TRINITY_DN16091_c0_g1_i2.p1 TRINITY_DN16091_c0_g1~~TRINITY_DN16091_c0_g1_i2.p1  ORF type:complete len:361 (-),score=90.90 TRINITY_DN16091_c0_g1_i2:132-1214(-)
MATGSHTMSSPGGGRKSSRGGGDDGILNGSRNGVSPKDKEGRKRLSGSKRLPPEAASEGGDNGNQASAASPGLRTKKQRSAANDEEEEEPSAVYVDPVDEALDADLQQGPEPEHEPAEPCSDPEAGAFEDARLDFWGDADGKDGADHDFDAWRKAIEELRRQRKPELSRRSGDVAVSTRPTPEELLRNLRQALQGGDWANVTALASLPRSSDLASVVKKLKREEALQTIAALAARHESHPRERWSCNMWIHQVLETWSHSLGGRRELRAALRPLLAALAGRLGVSSRAEEVLSCLGKWRMLTKLGKMHRQAAKNGSASAADGDEEGDAEDGDDADDDDDDEEEAEATAAAEADDSENGAD